MSDTTAEIRERIFWYRTPLDKELLAGLYTRSDARGWVQVGTYLGLLLCTGGLALYSAGHWAWWLTVAVIFGHGTFFSTMSAPVHELIHRTVFKKKSLNDWWARFFSFFSWMNNTSFQPSHIRHHQSTLHQPDDLEVVLPQKTLLRHFFQYGLCNPRGVWRSIKNAWRLANGRFQGEWELKTLPASEPEKRAAVVRWGKTQLLGHGLILLGSIALGLLVSPVFLLVPILTTCGAFYGGWLIMLMATPQHIGLQDEVADYRLCCRTFTTNRFFEFLYWNMNYHIEHHMFAAVPGYNLRKLHRAMLFDLPPCPHGLIATWREIFEIMKRQRETPEYQFVAAVPGRANVVASDAA